MDAQAKGLTAAIDRGWKAIVRAFTPTRAPGLPDVDGSDTTLFGPSPEPPEQPARNARSGFWGGAGDSSYLGDHDDADHPRRR
jgi:hypothetical protein